MRVLVTGAFGYLGARLAATLPYDTVLGARGTPEWVHEVFPRREIRPLDVLDPDQARRAVAGIDAVVHLASLDEREAERNPELALRVSDDGTRNLLEACSAANVTRFVYLSTVHVYGAGAAGLLSESAPVEPVHPYAVARLAGENHCKAVNASRAETPWAVTVRLSNGYGAPVHAHVDRFSLAHNDFCKQVIDGDTITLATSGVQQRDFVWVEDVVQALVLLLETPRLGHSLFHVGSGRSRSIRTVADVVATRARAVLGKDVSVEAPGVAPGGDVEEFRYDIRRMRALGYTPRDALVHETDRLLRLLERDRRV